MSDDCPVGSPHYKSLTHLVIDQEQIQLLAQLTMITLQGFLLGLKTGLQLFLGWESCPIDPLQHLVLFVTPVISPSQPQQLKRLNLSRALHMGAGTQIGKLTICIKRNRLTLRDVA